MPTPDIGTSLQLLVWACKTKSEAGVDAINVTHTNLGHWDDAAQKLLPKDLPLLVQNESDAKIIHNQGFKDVRILEDGTEFSGVPERVGGASIMGKEDLVHAAQAVPKARIVTTHMDAINRTGQTREELKAYVTEKGIEDRVAIPEDDATLQL